MPDTPQNTLDIEDQDTDTQAQYPLNQDSHPVVLKKLMEGIKRSAKWEDKIDESDLHTLTIMLDICSVSDNGTELILSGYIKHPTGPKHKEWETTKEGMLQAGMISDENGTLLLHAGLLGTPDPMDSVASYIKTLLDNNSMADIEGIWKKIRDDDEGHYQEIPIGKEMTEMDISLLVFIVGAPTGKNLERATADLKIILEGRKNDPNYNPYEDPRLFQEGES